MQGPDRLRVAVIGGGPGGARCAERLAEAGCAVTLFEPRTRFEKACGGGIPARGIGRYPYLLDPRLPGKEIRECLLVAPSGREARFPLRDPLWVFSRADLHGFMLDRAVAAGVLWVRARVLSFRREPGGWIVGSGAPRTPGAPGGGRPAEVHAPFDFLVAADGAAGFARRKLSPGAPRGNVAQGIGYYLPRISEDFITLKFYAGLEGYLWVFPRPGHASAGICAPLGALPAADLKALMDRFLEGRYPEGILERSEPYAALIPGAGAEGRDPGAHDGGAVPDAPLVGDGWAVVGDAGRFVDPLTREGIYYAMESGDLLADALIAGKPEQYSEAWSRRFAPELSRAARVATRFFDTRFLERLVFLGGRSPAIARVLSDLIAGRQPYRSLKRRLVLTVPVVGVDLVARALVPRPARPAGGSRSTDR
jgi:geranylgeranyl reductase